MQKENGMLKPADKKELAGIKGKTYYCPACKKRFNLEKSSFSETFCKECQSPLLEEGLGTEAGKLTGRGGT